MNEEIKTKYFISFGFNDYRAIIEAYEITSTEAYNQYAKAIARGDENHAILYVGLYRGVPFQPGNVLLEQCHWIGRKIK